MLIVAGAFAMIHVQGHAQEKFNLSYKLEKGKTYKYIKDNIIETTQEMGGQEMKMSTDGHSVVKYVVDEVTNEGIMFVSYSYDEVKYHMKGMGRDTVMDMRKMLEKITKAEITKYGKVLKETSADSVKSSKPLMSLTMFTGSNFVLLPEQPVAIGETWPKVSTDTTISEESQMVLKRNITYTLKGKEKKGSYECIKVDFKGTLEITGKMQQRGMDLVMEGSGDTSGSFWFDPSSGLMVEELNNTNIDMTMALTGQSQMTIPMTQKITTTQKLSQ